MFVNKKELERILRNLRHLEQDIRIDLTNVELLAEDLDKIANPPRLRHDKRSFIKHTSAILERIMKEALSTDEVLTESEMFAKVRDKIMQWFRHLESVM